MNNSSVSNLRKALALLGASLSVFAAQAAFAQAADSAADTSKEAVKLDKFVVTGSSIPATLDEQKALPVQIVDTQAIDASGVNTNVLEVLKKTVPQIQGGLNIGNDNANISGNSTNGGSQVALRNTATLVLINGKRAASSPVASNGGYTFVDLNLIPVSAVDHIEVLTDGASAIYGTDAVSGVVNVILKKDYRGGELTAHYTLAPNDTNGYWRAYSTSFAFGAGTDKTNVLITGEWSKTAPIWERDVAYDNVYYGTSSVPGNINDGTGQFYRLKAGLNGIPAANAGMTLAQLVAAGIYTTQTSTQATQVFNLSDRPTISQAMDKRSVVGNISHIFTDKITLNADMIYAQTDGNYQLNPQPVTASTTSLIANGITTMNTKGVTIRNRFLGGPNRIYDNLTDFYRGTFTLSGKFNDYFNLDVSANYNFAHQESLGYNLILNSALLNGIYSGLINLFAITQDPTKMATANIYGTSEALYTSKLYTYNATANGKIFDLPSGPVQYAAALEYRKEQLHAGADYNSIIPPGGTTSLWNNGTSLAPFDGGRSAKSEFAELKVPFFSPSQHIIGLNLLTVDGAIRHEDYSDGNKTSVPKVSVRWMPFDDQLAIRATYAKSFAEPALYSLYGPSSSGFTTSLGALPAYDGSGNKIGFFPNLQGHSMGGSNPGLKPSHAKSNTIGFVYSPKFIKNLDITVDFYKINETDLISQPAGTTTMIASVEQLGAASPYAPYVALGAFPGQGGTAVTAPGQLHGNPDNIYVLTGLVNIAGQNQKGWDISARYTLPWKQYGKIVIDTRWALVTNWIYQSSAIDPGTDYSGTDANGTIPKTRNYTTVDWSYQGYGATLGVTHLNSIQDGYGDVLNPYTTVDLQFRTDLGKVSPLLKGFNVEVGVNNVNNQKPIIDKANFASPPFDPSANSYFGRMYYADLKVKF